MDRTNPELPANVDCSRRSTELLVTRRDETMLGEISGIDFGHREPGRASGASSLTMKQRLRQGILSGKEKRPCVRPVNVVRQER
jgi:hypothetical protein